jgi:hypothetical protein
MRPSTASDPSALIQGILSYLGAHPEAADTLEGIASWWLPPPTYSVTLENLQTALDRMAGDRRIARIHLADGRMLFQSAEKRPNPHSARRPARRRTQG